MKLSVAFLTTLVALVSVEASVSNAIRREDGALHARHARVGRRASAFPVRPRQSLRKRCKAKSVPSTNNSSSGGPAPGDNPSPSSPSDTSPPPAPSSAPSNGTPPAPSSAPSPAPSQSSPSSNASPSDNHLLSVQSSCGPIGATSDIQKGSGPNGAQGWLNCGIDGGGWTPPFVKISDISTVDLRTSLNSPNSPFHPCSDYIDLFESNAQQHGYPSIILAAFAMQESGCNPGAIGGGGEQGLMQITKDKCGGAPGGNCLDVGYNIATGAQFFADTLNGNGGDLLKSIGAYNGWFVGMTTGAATAAANSGCCRCQQNLDYMNQFLNGWCQGIDGRSIGLVDNLAVCK